MTSQQEARDAIDAHAIPVYGRPGYGNLKPGGVVYERLVDLLTNPINDGRPGRRVSKSAERFRDHLWSTFSGGGTSANVTRAVFAAVGREDETDPNWI